MMILGIGTDIIKIDRVIKLLENPKAYKRIFHPLEIEYAKSKKMGKFASLAARFAAKEAFQKVWQENISWQDVWVTHKNKKPVFEYSEKIHTLMKKNHLFAHLSLSHCQEYALAYVILEQEAPIINIVTHKVTEF